MPIDISALAQNMVLPAGSASGEAKESPKFFNKLLTGSGGAVGVLNRNRVPGRVSPTAGNLSNHELDRASRSIHNGIATTRIPFAPLHRDSLLDPPLVTTYSVPTPSDEQLARMFHVTEGRANAPVDLYLDLVPQGMIVREDESRGSSETSKVGKEYEVLYRIDVWALSLVDPATGARASERIRVIAHNGPQDLAADQVSFHWSYGPLDDAPVRIASAASTLWPSGLYVDIDGLKEWMGNYPLYTRVQELAQIWSTAAIGELVADHVEALAADQALILDSNRRSGLLNSLATQLRYLETYSVPLDAYVIIYKAIEEAFDEETALIFAKQNMNLLMSHTLKAMNSVRDEIAPAVLTNDPTAVLPQFSPRQRAAICATDPFIQVQSGAGTGKTSTIMGRLTNLLVSGIAPTSIVSLSFTNAAADNMTERMVRLLPDRPDLAQQVHSSTIASLINAIYSLNHPTHEISEAETLINTVSIFFPGDAFAGELCSRLKASEDNKQGATTRLNELIERNFARTLHILDTVRQTTLGLQIIICYNAIETMAQPANLRPQHIILDEVQDNSVFEFIYILRLAMMHRSNLFIVGDANQSLYEFRDANPRALNTLEASGVFTTFQLSTNYRSNQEILDFANVLLENIEVNQIAGLQLQANDLASPTAETFRQKVRLETLQVEKQKDFTDNFNVFFERHVKNYIDECLGRGERIAFLSYSRRLTHATKVLLEELYPGEQVASLVSDKVAIMSTFSKVIKESWDTIIAVPDVKTASFLISKTIENSLINKDGEAVKNADAVMDQVNTWWIENAASINSMADRVNANQISREEFFDFLRDNMLNHEIAINKKRTSFVSRRNNQRKEENLASSARLLVSTIHGAKGLEFDNAVITMSTSKLEEETEKRMNYVALTRAMKTELVFAYGVKPQPSIQTDYALILTRLKQTEVLTTIADRGTDLGKLEDEDQIELIDTVWLELYPEDQQMIERRQARDRELAERRKAAEEKAQRAADRIAKRAAKAAADQAKAEARAAKLAAKAAAAGTSADPDDQTDAEASDESSDAQDPQVDEPGDDEQSARRPICTRASDVDQDLESVA